MDVWRKRLSSRWVCALLCATAISGCDRALVTGRTLTDEGEALPGVAVTFNENPAETLSNGVGEFTTIVPEGEHQIRYSKSGYAPAVLTVEVTRGQSNTIPEIRMWRLPPAKGVYLYDGLHFRATEGVDVREFVLEDGTAQEAIRVVPELVTAESAGLRVVVHNMPRFEAQLVRLSDSVAALRTGQEPTIPVWIDAGAKSVALEPLDAPEGLLLQVVLESALEPGIYGLHWGALNRETALEPRVHVFAVSGVTGEESVEAPAEPAKDAELTEQ